eukprot:CAMPEP_0196687884 /NCGR_PEP_ID=MMETSP1090-20130531/15688_1 /TAXON_ID=37098 /ORGANISM="Isochrysis sp, Strain CCMP1244" /LENGTH=65 /DNA_ID=CAMNT_0042026731 /DNA_START=25 /DNA_END=218 /DNA_ORIENTATION=-
MTALQVLSASLRRLSCDTTHSEQRPERSVVPRRAIGRAATPLSPSALARCAAAGPPPSAIATPPT